MQNKQNKSLELEMTLLFDSQINLLREKGVNNTTLTLLNRFRESVIREAVDEGKKEGVIPFLPVISAKFVSIHDMMLKVRKTDIAYNVFLDPDEMVDTIKAPRNPYYLLNVTLERVKKEVLEKAHKRILKKTDGRARRRGLTLTEAVNLAVHLPRKTLPLLALGTYGDGKRAIFPIKWVPPIKGTAVPAIFTEDSWKKEPVISLTNYRFYLISGFAPFCDAEEERRVKRIPWLKSDTEVKNKPSYTVGC